MARAVALLLLLLLVGCGGALPGLRTGTDRSTLRDSGVDGNTPTQGQGQPLAHALLLSVPPGATTAAEAATATATGEALVAGGSVVAVGGSVVLVCLTVQAAADGTQTPLDIADTFYGTHFGDVQGWYQGCYVPRATGNPAASGPTPEAKTVSETHASSVSEQSPETRQPKDGPKHGRIYATYTKFSPQTGRYYSGRTSMVIDRSKPLRAQALVAVSARDSNHHLDENNESKDPGLLQAQLDEFDAGTAVDYANRYNDVAYWRIRGREQQLMDAHGGAQSDTRQPYRTENIQRGVAKDNPLGRLFHDAATKHWGQIHPYTGD